MSEPRVIIVDTGPLVALTDKRDHMHQSCNSVLKGLSAYTQLVTVTSVLTEAFALLPQNQSCINKLIELLNAIPIKLESLRNQDLPRIEQLMVKYHDLPMDFADAEIVTIAENLNITHVFTLDRRDFSVYRPNHTKVFRLLPTR